MSSSMSPPSQRSAAPPFPTPFQGNSTSPVNASPYGQPPAKRQRLSPDVQQGGPVTSAYGNPYASQPAQTVQSPQTYAGSPQSSFHTPQPYPFQQMPWQSQPGTPTAGQNSGAGPTRHGSPPSHQSREMMPPPPRPNREEREEKVGVEEIGDSLFGSGINLKDEENYLQNVYNNRHAGDSLHLSQNLSFGSTTVSAGNSFNALTQDTSFGSQDSSGISALAGTIGQARSQEDIELEERRKREAAAKARAERMQHHLNNQFLLCNNVRARMDRLARNHGVGLNLNGLAVRPLQTSVALGGTGTEGIVAVSDRAKSSKVEERTTATVAQGAPFEHVLALISLAAGERIRGLLDESFSLARSRRYGDHGRVVPPEFSDIAEGEGKRRNEEVVPESVTGSQWDKVPNGSLTREAETVNGTGQKEDTAQAQPTLSFQGNLNVALRAIAERDRRAEKERIKRREARKRSGDAAANGEAIADTPGESSAPNGTAEAAAPVKISKKEQAKQQKEKSNIEAQSNNTVNQTAAMMALGRKGNRYSWMSGGAANLPTNRFAKPSTSGSATPAGVKQEARSPAAGDVAMRQNGSAVGAELQWGDFREDSVDGKGVQLRDWILVLERDGREKRALQKALLKKGGPSKS